MRPSRTPRRRMPARRMRRRIRSSVATRKARSVAAGRPAEAGSFASTGSVRRPAVVPSGRRAVNWACATSEPCANPECVCRRRAVVRSPPAVRKSRAARKASTAWRATRAGRVARNSRSAVRETCATKGSNVTRTSPAGGAVFVHRCAGIPSRTAVRKERRAAKDSAARCSIRTMGRLSASRARRAATSVAFVARAIRRAARACGARPIPTASRDAAAAVSTNSRAVSMVCLAARA